MNIPGRFSISRKSPILELFSGEKESYTYLEFLEELDLILESENIQTIGFVVERVDWGFAEITEVGRFFQEMKARGKKVKGYAFTGDLRTLLLLSYAGERYSLETGEFTFFLPAVETFFWGKFLKKYGVDVEAYTSGKFKSFAEPFQKDRFSIEAKDNLQSLIRSLKSQLLSLLESNTGIDWTERSRPIMSSKELKEIGFFKGFTDDVQFRKFFHLGEIPSEDGEREAKPGTSETLKRWKKSRDFSFFPKKKNSVLVLPLKGNIQMGSEKESEMKEGVISAHGVLSVLRSVSDEDSYKVLILEIDSGGGSAFASELIYRELKKMSKKIKIYAYFQNISASGGYYIGCGAMGISSSPFCITGSIGTVSIRANLKGLYDKLGVYKDRIEFYPGREIFSEYGKLTEFSKKFMNSEIERIKNQFYGVVAEARKISLEDMESRGGGRVFTGTDFLKMGMVDSNEGFFEYIKKTIEKENINNYKIDYYIPIYNFRSMAKNLMFAVNIFKNPMSILQNYREKSPIEYRFPFEKDFKNLMG